MKKEKVDGNAIFLESLKQNDIILYEIFLGLNNKTKSHEYEIFMKNITKGYCLTLLGPYSKMNTESDITGIPIPIADLILPSSPSPASVTPIWRG